MSSGEVNPASQEVSDDPTTLELSGSVPNVYKRARTADVLPLYIRFSWSRDNSVGIKKNHESL